MITVKKEQPVSNVITSDKVVLGGGATKYGVWAIGKTSSYKREVLKLIEPIPESNKKYWYFCSMNGTHGGWSNHSTVEQSINTLMHDFDIVIPETKEELIKLLQDNLK